MEAAKDSRYACTTVLIGGMLPAQAYAGLHLFIELAGRRPKWFMGTLMELRKKGAARTHQIWARVTVYDGDILALCNTYARHLPEGIKEHHGRTPAY